MVVYRFAGTIVRRLVFSWAPCVIAVNGPGCQRECLIKATNSLTPNTHSYSNADKVYRDNNCTPTGTSLHGPLINTPGLIVHGTRGLISVHALIAGLYACYFHLYLPPLLLTRNAWKRGTTRPGVTCLRHRTGNLVDDAFSSSGGG